MKNRSDLEINAKSNTYVRHGGFFLPALTLLFIALKLGIGNTAVMSWSWLWVLAPMWIPFALGLAFVVGTLLFLAVVAGIVALVQARKFKRKK